MKEAQGEPENSAGSRFTSIRIPCSVEVICDLGFFEMTPLLWLTDFAAVCPNRRSRHLRHRRDEGAIELAGSDSPGRF
jgi:hypothetical protein